MTSLVTAAGGVWLVAGIQGAGKSTVADLLANTFERGVHVRGGQFYRWALSGWVHPSDADREAEARRLLDLRYRLSALVADEYCLAGFTAVAQDNIYGEDVIAWLDRVKGRPRHLVVLRPSLAAVRERDDARRERTGKVAYHPDKYTIEDLDRQLGMTAPVGLWLDTSHKSPEETTREILRRQAETAIDASARSR